MITYQEFIKDPDALHDAYADQFVTEDVIRIVRGRFSINTLRKAGDSFNGIALRHWDTLAFALDTKEMRNLVKSAGGYWNLSTRVCILKEAAKRIVAEEAS